METFIPGVYEHVVQTVGITTLTNRQYCVILNPTGPNGKPQLGSKKLVKGEKSFFLQPGEVLENGVQDVYVLGDNEGIVLKAIEGHKDTFISPPVERKPGDKWMMTGPLEYIPPVQVVVLSTRRSISLHQNEGIYVRNTNTGNVRAVTGKTYMLKEDEELWEKHLPLIVKTLLSSESHTAADKHYAKEWKNPGKEKGDTETVTDTWDPTRVVTFQVPHNSAVQLYDYKSKMSRVVFGPDLVMLVLMNSSPSSVCLQETQRRRTCGKQLLSGYHRCL